MKARIKATGEIVEVIAISDYINENGQIIGEYKDGNGMLYASYDLDFYVEEGITIPDYWTRLEHTYAGMAMQAYIIASHISQFSFCEGDMKDCKSMAHALVEKMKEERK